MSVCCPDSVETFRINSVRCLSVRIFSCLDSVRISEKKLSVVCQFGRTRTRQSCPDFHCSCPPTYVPNFYNAFCFAWILYFSLILALHTKMLKEIDRNETKSKGSPKMKRRKSMEINNSSSIQILHTNRLLQTKNKKNKRKWILCATIPYVVQKYYFYIVIGAILGFHFFDLRRFSNFSTGYNFNGVCSIIWFWPSETLTGRLSYIKLEIILKLIDIHHVTEWNFTSLSFCLFDWFSVNIKCSLL